MPLQMTIAISSTKRARWCLPSWNALPTTIKKVVMTSVTSGCADWQQRPSNTLLKTECITEHLTTIDYGKQIDYTHVGGETEILEMESVKVDGSKYGVDEIFQVEQLDGFKPVKLKSIPDEDLQTFLNRMEKK